MGAKRENPERACFEERSGSVVRLLLQSSGRGRERQCLLTDTVPYESLPRGGAFTVQ